MERQQEARRAARRFAERREDEAVVEVLKRVGPTEFTGYEGVTGSGRVVGLIVEGVEVDSISAPQEALVVLDKTPFYAESGGQIGDRGDLSGSMGVFQVQDTRRPIKGLIVHYGRISEGYIRVGDSVQANVVAQRREDTMRNHSATHLLHKALRDIIGPQLDHPGPFAA